jgi:nucleoside-diphosphate-sugar epimerase
MLFRVSWGQVTGGAGFVGSNLVDVLMQQGHIVYVLDNLYTGRRKNIDHWRTLWTLRPCTCACQRPPTPTQLRPLPTR